MIQGTRLSRRCLGLPLLLAVALGSIAPLLVSLPFMRLIGDDYIFAAYAKVLGILASVALWSNFFASPVASFFMFLHGWWAAVVPTWMTYLPLSLFMMLFAAAVGMSIIASATGLRLGRLQVVTVGLFSVTMWILAFGNLGNDHDAVTLFSHLNWFSASYRAVLAFAWFFAVFLILLVPARLPSKAAPLIFIPLGLLLSLIALNPLPDLLAYLFGTLLLAVLSQRSSSDGWSSSRVRRLLFLALGQALGTALLLMSPGAAGRRQWLRFSSPEDPVAAVAGQALVFAREAVNPSLILVFVGTSALVGFLALTNPIRERCHIPALWDLTWVSTALLILLTMSGSTNVLIGPGAVWHRWGVQAMAFIACLLWASLAGLAIAKRWVRLRFSLLVIAMVCSAISFVPSLSTSLLIMDRAKSWAESDSEVMYIWDKKMFAECWAVLQEGGSPGRSSDFVPVNPCNDLRIE